MEIQLFNNKSDNRCIRKELINGLSVTGSLKESCDVLAPVINFECDALMKYNYAYIPDFRRYYFITKFTNVVNNVWEVEFKVDPLMSFKGDILALSVVVDKQSDKIIGDEYIDDGSLVTDNYTFKEIYNYSKGFNNESQYILITAG